MLQWMGGSRKRVRERSKNQQQKQYVTSCFSHCCFNCAATDEPCCFFIEETS